MIHKVTGYYRYLWDCRYAKQDADLFDGLPQNLMMQVDVSLKRQLVEQVELFQNVSLTCLVELVRRLVPMISLPDEYVIIQGEEGKEMLFLKMGAVKVSAAPSPCHTAVPNVA